MRRARHTVAGLLLLGACSRESLALPPGWTATEATAFQRQHETDTATPTGPLSTVGSHYLGPGQSLILGVVDGALVVDPPTAGERVRIEVTDDGARCLEGCGPLPVEVTERRQVSFDRFTLGLSPQSGTLRVLIHDPKSPALSAFDGLVWFPVDPAFIVPARWQPDAERPSVDLSTSRGLTKSFVRAGTLTARVQDHDITLIGYQAGPEGTLLVPLTDQTTGVQSYPVGRYLEVSVPTEGPAVLDFNRLTNPWCAYSEHYNCPIPPKDNQLALSIAAGEKVYAAH